MLIFDNQECNSPSPIMLGVCEEIVGGKMKVLSIIGGQEYCRCC